MKQDILGQRSVAFAVRITKLKQYLVDEKKEFDLSKQILRSGTSIGANITEAGYAQSKPDFITKMHIALKETAETMYWLKVLELSEYLPKALASSLLADCEEIKKMLVSSLKTIKNSN